MSKRSNGEGNVRQRPNGTWEARLSYIDAMTGKRRRASFYGSTAEAARAELAQARDRIKADEPVKDSTDTLGSFIEVWFDTALEASDRKESTKSLYRTLARNHIVSTLGRKPLAELRKSNIDGLIVSLRKKGLSDSTVRQVYTVLRAILEDAKLDGLIAVNTATKVKRPTVEQKEANYLSTADVAKLLAAAETLRYATALKFVAATGLRRGEALGLHWKDVTLTDKPELKVNHTLSRVEGELLITEPKTKRSRRTLPLSPGMVKLLKTQKAAQAAERLHAGDQWLDSGLVFTTEFGGPVDPRNLLRTAQLAAKKAGLENVGVHTLRHSAGMAWFESGTHIKAIADLLGHYSISITGDIYGHTSPETSRAAMDGLSSELGL